MTESNTGTMAEWNAYYQNDDEDDGLEEGEQFGGEVKTLIIITLIRGLCLHRPSDLVHFPLHLTCI